MTAPTNGLLRVLLIGDRERNGPVKALLDENPNVSSTLDVADTHHAWSAIRSERVNTVFIALEGRWINPNRASKLIVSTREQHPEIVFVLLTSDAQLDHCRPELLPDFRRRTRHYYTLDPTLAPEQLQAAVHKAVERCLAWHDSARGADDSRAYYEYDVALSFAGEDRVFAQELAAYLIGHGATVFFDDFEQAELWGKNLYDRLFDVYSKRARFCIMLISNAYRDKMWTNHERTAAQQRALEMRNEEYILPVMLEQTEIPGLPKTVAYLPGQLSPGEIAQIFVRKLGRSTPSR
jgi:TIR domain